MDTTVATTSLLALTSSVSIFNSFCPPFEDVIHGSPSKMTPTVRLSEIASAALAVSIGLVGSMLTKSPIPAVLAILAAGALVLTYEGVLRINPSTVTS